MSAGIVTKGEVVGTGISSPGQLYQGHIQMGQKGRYVAWGEIQFNSTDLTCTLSIPAGYAVDSLLTTYIDVVDKTVKWSLSGPTITLTRSDNTSGGKCSIFIITN